MSEWVGVERSSKDTEHLPLGVLSLVSDKLQDILTVDQVNECYKISLILNESRVVQDPGIVVRCVKKSIFVSFCVVENETVRIVDFEAPALLCKIRVKSTQPLWWGIIHRSLPPDCDLVLVASYALVGLNGAPIVPNELLHRSGRLREICLYDVLYVLRPMQIRCGAGRRRTRRRRRRRKRRTRRQRKIKLVGGRGLIR